MLELDDIQHILLTRAPAITGRYEFLSFATPAGGRAWLVGADRPRAVGRRGDRAAMDDSRRWVTVAFTWNGLRALGVRRGVAGHVPRGVPQGHGRPRRDPRRHRARITPTTGWAAWPSDDLHAIAILFARDERATPRCPSTNHDELLARMRGGRSLSFLDLNATPPFNYAHDHFGFRDRLSQPVIEGSGEEPTPGSGAPLKPGEFILGYPDEDGPVANLPQPEVLSRNGSYMAYRRCEEHVGAFRDFLRENGRDAGGAGAARREAHGPLAQRRAAGAGAGEGRSRAGRRSAAQQRLQLQGDGSARLCACPLGSHMRGE